MSSQRLPIQRLMIEQLLRLRHRIAEATSQRLVTESEAINSKALMTQRLLPWKLCTGLPVDCTFLFVELPRQVRPGSPKVSQATFTL